MKNEKNYESAQVKILSFIRFDRRDCVLVLHGVVVFSMEFIVKCPIK